MNDSTLRQCSGSSILLALTCMLASCIGIPEDELARLDAIEADWTRPISFDGTQPQQLRHLQEFAIRTEPGLTALFHRYKAALQRIIVSGALDDPRVQFGYFIDSVETRVGPQEWKAGVSQAFPFWGKRDLRAEISLHEAHELREYLIEQRFGIARDVEHAYWNLFFLDRSHLITKQQIRLLEDLAQSIEARFLSGTAPRADYISILMEVDRQTTELKNIGTRMRDARAQLNALLDRDPGDPIALLFSDIDQSKAPALDDGMLIERAKDYGPVRVQSHRILRQSSAVALAELGYFPDIALGYDYISTGRAEAPPMMSIEDNGKDPKILGVAFNLPFWWNRIEAEIEQAGELVEAERASRREMIRSAESTTVAAIEAAREQEENRILYVDRLIPQAEEKLELSEQDYVGDRVDLDRLIAAERELLDLRLKLAGSIAGREKALAELDYLTAGGLGRLPAVRPAAAADIPEIEMMKTEESLKP